MRVIVFGAGAVGGTIGGRMFEHGHDVVLVARGPHYEAIRDRGLRIESPENEVVVPVPVVARPQDIAFSDADVVMLAMKSQHTGVALDALAAAAPPTTPILCAQNGVENERVALRLFANVYGVHVNCPSFHLTPGVVGARLSPPSGILDVGRYPAGIDQVVDDVVHILRESTFFADPRPDILRWKYTKLLRNIANAVESVLGPGARNGPVYMQARQEAESAYRSAGIEFAGRDEDEARRNGRLISPPPDGWAEGDSMRQSLTRSAGSIEVDYLNGEIVLLGRLGGVPTPVNAALQQLARRMLVDGAPPGYLSEEGFWSAVRRWSPHTTSERG